METAYDMEAVIKALPDPNFCERDYWSVYDIPNDNLPDVRKGLLEDEGVVPIKLLTFKRQVMYCSYKFCGYEWVLEK